MTPQDEILEPDVTQPPASPETTEPDIKDVDEAPVVNADDSPPATEPTEGSAIRDAISDLGTQLGMVKDLIANRLTYDKTKEEAFERLYDDLEAHKEDRLYDILRPLFFDLVLLNDRVSNAMQEGSPEGSPGVFLQSVSDEILEILARRGVDLILTDSVHFDPTLQQAIGVQPAPCSEEHNLIGEVIRKGFRFGKRIVRAEEVVVLKYSDPEPPNEPTEPTDTHESNQGPDRSTE